MNDAKWTYSQKYKKQTKTQARIPTIELINTENAHVRASAKNPNHIHKGRR